MYLQQVHQTLSQHGLKAPVIRHVCGDKSVFGGVFAVMDLMPGEPLFEQKPEAFASVLGESMARMHELDVGPIVDSFRRAGVPDDRFLSPFLHQTALDFFEKKTPWSSELILWFRDH